MKRQVLFVIVWLWAPLAAAEDDPTVSKTEVEMACLADGAKPTKDDCAGRLVIAMATKSWDEQFRLSVNDPIESFSYAGRYRPDVDYVYLRPPVMGGLRDRFVTQDPFASTLLFTTVVGGVGIERLSKPVSVMADVNLIYFKQRFAPNYVHSTEALDPESERVFGFAQFAGMGEAKVVLVPTRDFTLELWGSRVHLIHDGERLKDEELAWKARWTFARWTGGNMGLTAERYWRWQTIRHDGLWTGFDVSRAGVFVEL